MTLNIKRCGLKTATAIAVLASPTAFAITPTMFGVLDYSVVYTNNSRANQDRSDSEKGGWFAESNFTRLGLKGTEEVDNDLSFVYHAEVELKSDDGGDTFGSRNTYVGLKSKQFGQLIFGRIDAVLKQSKAGVDVFALTSMSYNRLFAGNGRFNDAIQYTTPSWYNFKLHGYYLFDDDSGDAAKDNDDPYQVALHYGDKGFSKSNLYAAVAYSGGVELIDALRGVIEYKWGDWTFGGIAQDTEAQKGFKGGGEKDRDDFGFIVSSTYKMGSWKFKGQYGQDKSGTGIIATNVYADNEVVGNDVPEVSYWGLGADYKFTKQLLIHTEFGQYMIDQGDYEDFEDDIFAIGLKYSF